MGKRGFMFCLVIISFLSWISTSSSTQLSLAVAKSTRMQLFPSLLVEGSPGIKPGNKVACERVQIQGLSRLKNLSKFSHSVKVNVSLVHSSVRPPEFELCFHRNASVGIGMCPQERWEKVTKGSWAKSISPFDSKFLDIRMAVSSPRTLEVYLDEDFFAYRVVFLVLGIVLLTLAPFLSQSLVFYYSGAMAVGVALVVLIVLFQGMRLLPTGRKNSLAIFLYSSIVGLGSFLLRYVPGLVRSILVEIGIDEDMFNPLAIFFVSFLVLAGAWMGFWVVRKLVLTEDGSIDFGVAQFVAWSIRIFASVMILQSSVDPLLALEALICSILFSSILRRISHPRFVRHLYKKLCRIYKSIDLRPQIPYSSPSEDSYGKYNIRSPKSSKFTRPQPVPFAVTSCSTKSPPSTLSDTGTFYSSFHSTPERRKFSKGEWEKFTNDSTKKALEGLVSSPDFSKWAVAHADRITLTPHKDASVRKRRWFSWF